MPAKILIVEDDAVARTVLVSALKPDKYEIAISPDALSALSQARKQKPDLILLDLGLPAGGGYTFLQRLKQLPDLSVIPVIVVSGYDAKTHEPRTSAAGVSAYLQKPVKPEEVRAAVRRYLSDQDSFAPAKE
jgi:CheY-like chemotaxis protein